MKKNNIFYACAAAALMFASCQKEGPVADGTTPDIPQSPFSEMGVITATTVDTKVTTLDGVNVLWEKGDKIQLFTRTWNEGTSKFDASWCDYNSSLESPSATATFVRDAANTNTVDNTSGKYFAIYHKGATVVTQSRDYYAQIALTKEQVAKNGGDFVSTILYSTSEDSDFAFAHAVSYLKFTVDQNTTPFNKLIVSPVNSSEVIVSRIQINWATETSTAAPFTGKSQDSKTVSVTTDDNAAFAPGTYYIAINPSTYTEGLEFTFENGEAVYSKVSPANVEMTPGAVADMGTIGTLKFPSVSDKLGTLYSDNGVSGVIFWVDENQPNAGKIVSGAGTQIKWGTASTYTWAPYIDTDNGAANHEYVLNVEGSSADAYPAVYYCKNLGDGWRLPTVNELSTLAKTYYGIVGEPEADGLYYTTEPYMTNAAAFDAVLAQIATDDPNTEYDETKIAMSSNSWYWTGQGSSNLKIQRVKFAQKYAVGAAGATNANFVRCVRDVELN